jgi:outer membrane protein TolC
MHLWRYSSEELYNMNLQNKVFFLILITSQMAFASTLNIKDYLKEVSQSNGTFKAGELFIKAYGLRSSEASFDFLPALVGNVNYTDNRLVPVSSLYPSQTISYGGYLGLQTKLRTGTQLGFNYNANWTQMSGSPFVPTGGYWYNNPTLTISQPLWKDFWASYSKANEDALLASFKAQGYVQRYNQQQITFSAETTYWRLSLYREIIKFDQQALERTEKILKWNQKRVSMNVADRGDLLQAQAAMKQRQLQLQSDLETVRQICSDFNKLRGHKGDLVSEDVQAFDSALELKISVELKRSQDRLDVLATLQNNESIKAQADAGLEKVKPDISLYGVAQLSGRNTDFGPASQDAWDTNIGPSYQIGVKMNIPLDFHLISDINQGNRAMKMATEYASQKVKADAEQDWNDLQKKFKDVLTRFEMARELETLQKEKLDNERRRFNTGRTTSFQVLTFEDNYSDSQLGRLRIENDAITLRAQARFYNGETL